MLKDFSKSTIVALIIIIISGWIVYANSFNGEFVFDDERLVKDNIFIRQWTNIPRLFCKNIGAEESGQTNFYRPLQMVTYTIDYALGKLNVQGYHLTNILLHIFVALSLYQLISVLSKDRFICLLTSLFFIVHPVHTEAVTYISGRADPLSTLFILLCLIFYIKNLHSDRTSLYIFMLLSYILALLSKENSLVIPALLVIYHYTFKKKLKVKEFFSVLGVTLIYLLLRVTLLRSLLPSNVVAASLPQRMPGVFIALANYLRLLFLPFPLHMEYGNKLFYFTDFKAIAGILLASTLLIYAFRQRRTQGLSSFAIFWFFIGLLPVANIYPINAYMAEHWLYLPSTGFFLILAQALSRLYKNKRLKILTIFLILSLLAFYSYLTVQQNIYWREPLAFYERTLNYAPESPKVHCNLGNEYCRLGRQEEALASYKKAIENDPDCTHAYNNIGVLYSIFGRQDEALAYYKKVIGINPGYSKAYNNIGNVYSLSGRQDEAIFYYKKALASNSYYAEAYNNLALTYFHQGQYGLAIEYCNKAEELGFTNPSLLQSLQPFRKE